MAKLKN